MSEPGRGSSTCSDAGHDVFMGTCYTCPRVQECRSCGNPLPPTRLPVDSCSGACHERVHGPAKPDDLDALAARVLDERGR